MATVALLNFDMATAMREPGVLHHTDWKGTTRAVCTYNTAKGARIEGMSSGWVELSQELTEAGLGPSVVHAYWGYLNAGTTYTLELRDDNGLSCEGTLLETLGSFTANDRNRGKLLAESTAFDVGGTNSIIGASIKMSGPSG